MSKHDISIIDEDNIYGNGAFKKYSGYVVNTMLTKKFDLMGSENLKNQARENNGIINVKIAGTVKQKDGSYKIIPHYCTY